LSLLHRLYLFFSSIKFSTLVKYFKAAGRMGKRALYCVGALQTPPKTDTSDGLRTSLPAHGGAEGDYGRNDKDRTDDRNKKDFLEKLTD